MRLLSSMIMMKLNVHNDYAGRNEHVEHDEVKKCKS